MLINVYWLLKYKLFVWGISMMFPEHKGRLYSGQAWQGATSEAMKQGASWVRPPQRQTTAGADTEICTGIYRDSGNSLSSGERS